MPVTAVEKAALYESGSDGVIDAVKKNQLFESPGTSNYNLIDNKASTGFHNISLRIGIVF